MQKLLITIGVLLLISSLFVQEQDETLQFQDAFQQFKIKYQKSYPTSEELYRLKVFIQNHRYIQEYNAKNGPSLGETMFFDLTDEEFHATYLTMIADQDHPKGIKLPYNEAIKEFDWVPKGAVQYVKNQGSCGSCWTFGTTGVLEGHFAVHYNLLPDLAQQQLLDCSTTYDINFGCSGGMPSRALNYVQRNGITTEDLYPYKAVQSDCQVKGGKFKINGHAFIDDTEEALLAAIQQQPVSVGVDAGGWKYYDPKTAKVFNNCGDNLNHAVLAVGYDEFSIKIKNSWGPAWGDTGYIHLQRGANTCGVLNVMVIPL